MLNPVSTAKKNTDTKGSVRTRAAQNTTGKQGRTTNYPYKHKTVLLSRLAKDDYEPQGKIAIVPFRVVPCNHEIKFIFDASFKNFGGILWCSICGVHKKTWKKDVEFDQIIQRHYDGILSISSDVIVTYLPTKEDLKDIAKRALRMFDGIYKSIHIGYKGKSCRLPLRS